MTEAGSSQIVEIIEDEHSNIPFLKLEISEILAEIADFLSPESFLNFLLVKRSIYIKMNEHFEIYPNFWRNYFFDFPKYYQGWKL
ncbi:19434_t:CDS:1, partial [Dentiscutata erythropus]